MKALKYIGRAALVICLIYALATVFFTPHDDMPDWFVVLNLVAIVCFVVYMLMMWKNHKNKMRNGGK